MKIQSGKINFKSVDTSKLGTISKMQISNYEELNNVTKNYDVILKDVKKDFPYRKTKMDVNAIKIIARKKGLNFFEKLFRKSTVIDYFPVGNLKPIIKFDFTGSFMDFLKQTLAKVK